MALIEKYHVIADHYPVATGETIIEGMFGKLNSSGEVVLATGAASEVAIGVCGDTKSTSTSGLPTTNASSMGSFVNRVSDNFDETRASGRMTVYHSGGVFATNQYEALTFAVNEALYVSSNGKLKNTASTSGQIVGYVTKAPAAYDSGVPGTDINGSLTLGNYMEFKLVV
jgi:hypothetical protein